MIWNICTMCGLPKPIDETCGVEIQKGMSIKNWRVCKECREELEKILERNVPLMGEVK